MNDACPHRPACPGCSWFEVPYEEQLARKEAALRRAFAGYPALAAVEVVPCVGAAVRTDYRTRTKWAVDGPHIGLYGPGHVVIDTPSCRVAPKAARAVADVLRRRPAEPGPARLGALDVRCTADGRSVVTLVVDAPRPEQAQRHAEALGPWLERAAPPDLVGLAWSFRRSGAPTTLGGPPVPLAGESTVWDRVGLVDTPFPPGSFSQVHREQAAVLHRMAREAVAALPDARRAHVVDLYAGTGGVGLAVAAAVARVTLVESYGPAADAAGRAADRLGVSARVLGLPVDDALATLSARAAPDRGAAGAGADGDGAGGGPLVVLVDPPRTGLTARGLVALARLAPDLVVYVSCAPGTLARDLDVLATYGLVAAAATPVDLMPGTDQLEAVVILRLARPAPPTVVAEGRDWVVVTKPAFLPTVPHPEWPGSLDARLRDRAADLRPAHRLDVGTSGLVLFRRGDAAGDPLAGAAKTYVALVKGVTHKAGKVDRPLEEDGRRRPALTRYRRRAVVGGHSLIEVHLETGRTHQIRRHFASLGHPVVGDERYGDGPTNRFFAARHGLLRPFLHATRLALADGPVCESPLAPDLEATLASLRGD